LDPVVLDGVEGVDGTAPVVAGTTGVFGGTGDGVGVGVGVGVEEGGVVGELGLYPQYT